MGSVPGIHGVREGRGAWVWSAGRWVGGGAEGPLPLVRKGGRGEDLKFEMADLRGDGETAPSVTVAGPS